MKMKKSLLFATLFLLILAGCKSAKTTEEKVDDGIITFKFIQLNDVYEIAPLSGGRYGGMARVAHVVDSVRSVEPNTFLMMAGDFLSPSLLGSLEVGGERIMGKQMIDVMNEMRFDLVVFGNHEFDLKEAELQKRLNESNFQWIGTNVRQVTEAGMQPFTIQRNGQNLPVNDTYRLLLTDADGTEVVLGFFGVVLGSNPQSYVSYENYLDASKRAYSELEGNSDIIVGLTHLTLNHDKTLAETLPGLSFIMGGHEHDNKLLNAGNAKIAKADANAKTVYIHTLTYNRNQKRLLIDSHLFPIDESIAFNPTVADVVEDWNFIMERELKTVVDDPYETIYMANIPLDGTDSASRGIQTNLGGFIAESMAASFDYEVDAALVNGGSIRIDDMLEGEVVAMDIFRVLPFGGGVLKVDMTGEMLKQVLDFGKSKRGTGAYLQRFNVSQNERGEWLINQKEIDPKKNYKVAFSDFLLKGYDIPFLTPDHEGVLEVYYPESNEVAYDIRKAVISFLKQLK